MRKCCFGDGVIVKPNGIDELDPCIYEDIEMYTNVTVVISKCKKCGHIEVGWIRQENTEDVSYMLEG
jgi:hypothetical protein